jgi:hypothetical protein
MAVAPGYFSTDSLSKPSDETALAKLLLEQQRMQRANMEMQKKKLQMQQLQHEAKAKQLEWKQKQEMRKQQLKWRQQSEKREGTTKTTMPEEKQTAGETLSGGTGPAVARNISNLPIAAGSAANLFGIDPASIFSLPMVAGSGTEGAAAAATGGSGTLNTISMIAQLASAIIPFLASIGGKKDKGQRQRPNVPPGAGYTQQIYSSPSSGKLAQGMGQIGQVLMTQVMLKKQQDQMRVQREQQLKDADLAFGRRIREALMKGDIASIQAMVDAQEKARADREKLLEGREHKAGLLADERKHKADLLADKRKYDASIAGTKAQKVTPTMHGLMQLVELGADPKVLADKFNVKWLPEVYDEKMVRRAKAAASIEEAKDILDISRMGMRALSDAMREATFASATGPQKEKMRAQLTSVTEAYNTALQKVVAYGGKDLSSDQWEELRRNLEANRERFAGKTVDEIEQLIQESWEVEEDGATPMFISDYYFDKIYPLVLELSQSQ